MCLMEKKYVNDKAKATCTFLSLPVKRCWSSGAFKASWELRIYELGSGVHTTSGACQSLSSTYFRISFNLVCFYGLRKYKACCSIKANRPLGNWWSYLCRPLDGAVYQLHFQSLIKHCWNIKNFVFKSVLENKILFRRVLNNVIIAYFTF